MWGIREKQQNKRFTLLGAQFVRISLTNRATWQNICWLSSFLFSPFPFPSTTADLSIMEDFLFVLLSSPSPLQFQVESVSFCMKKICFSCKYNKWSDWSSSIKMAMCLMKEEELYWWNTSIFICRWTAFKLQSWNENQNVTIVLLFQWPLDGRSKNLIGVSQEGKSHIASRMFWHSIQHWFIISLCCLPKLQANTVLYPVCK